MKKTLGTRLMLRREHIRILTPDDLQKAVGGAKTTRPPPPPTETCENISNRADAC